MDENTQKPKSKLVGCGVLLFIFIALVVIATNSCESKPKQEHSKAAASVMAEQFVKDKLKSPGSAKFQSFSDQNITDIGDGRYTIAAWVDSQNSFGALIRTKYICTVKYAGDDKWQLENLEFK